MIPGEYLLIYEAMRTTKKSQTEITGGSLRFSPINFAFILAGIVAIAVGYTLLASGSTVAAPLLLVLGYAALIPIGIVL